MPRNSVILQEVPAACEEIATMSTENDVPLGEGSQRHYEELFGERIRQINKGDKARRPENDSSNGNGRLGCGVLIAIIFFIRFLTALFNSHSHTPTPARPPVPIHRPIVIDHPLNDVKQENPIRVPPGKRLPEKAKR